MKAVESRALAARCSLTCAPVAVAGVLASEVSCLRDAWRTAWPLEACCSTAEDWKTAPFGPDESVRSEESNEAAGGSHPLAGVAVRCKGAAKRRDGGTRPADARMAGRDESAPDGTLVGMPAAACESRLVAGLGAGAGAGAACGGASSGRARFLIGGCSSMRRCTCIAEGAEAGGAMGSGGDVRRTCAVVSEPAISPPMVGHAEATRDSSRSARTAGDSMSSA